MNKRTTSGGFLVLAIALAALAVASFASSARAEEAVASTSPAATATPAAYQSPAADQLDPAAFKAIVKIKTYVLNSDYELTLAAAGSGVIISPEGLVLTNNHVISIEDDFDGRYRDASYVVCLPQSIEAEPVCDYTAKLVRWNKDLDTALLKITPVNKLSQPRDFPYLNLNVSDTAKVNDTIFALGYPSIGGDTVTVTRGVVSGKNDKYQKKWIKTDAVVSFGNSGGAALDGSGRVIGITTEAHADLAGSIGYILNIASVNAWIEQYRSAAPRDSGLHLRLGELARKQKILLSSNKFISLNPPYHIIKPADWAFAHDDEDSVSVSRLGDDESGSVEISFGKTPFIVQPKDLPGLVKAELLSSGMHLMVDKISFSDVKIAGQSGKKVVLSLFGEEMDFYVLANREYIVKISYDYGADDKDKKVVDAIINSFRLGPQAGAFSEQRQFRSRNKLKVSLSASKDWALQEKNNSEQPLRVYYRKYPDAVGYLGWIKTDRNSVKLNNEGFLAKQKQEVEGANKMVGEMDIKLEIQESKAHYKLNREQGDVMRIKIVARKKSTKKIVQQEVHYYKKVGDKFFEASFMMWSDDARAFREADRKFAELLQTLSLKQ